MVPTIAIPRVIEKLGKHCLVAEVGPVLEIVYLAMVADGSVRDEELAAFDVIAGYLWGNVERATDRPYREQPVSESVEVDVDSLLDEYGRNVEREGARSRLRHAAVVLTRPSARDFAFQLSFLMFSSDLDTNQAESQWEGRIVRALEISEDWSNALVNEVLSAVSACS